MRVVSGIQPTGSPHLGNYFGALINWVNLQNDGNECFFFIANQHAITLPQDGPTLSKNILKLAATIIAIGIDPKKSALFVQSDVPAHTQLSWIFTCLAPMGQMERMIQFKEKSEKNPTTVNMGLFSYPILMASDILLYKTELVPVGIDQAQHLELTRMLAKKFNNQYKEIFPEPKTLHTETTKVVGLDGSAKMSKSQGNYIGIIEEKEAIWKKLAPAVTDPARIKKSDPGNPDICNLYSLHKLFSNEQDLDLVKNSCLNAEFGCIDCKKKLFESMEVTLGPIREKYHELIKRPNDLRDTLRDGAAKAQIVAQQTLDEVNELIGFRY